MNILGMSALQNMFFLHRLDRKKDEEKVTGKAYTIEN